MGYSPWGHKRVGQDLVPKHEQICTPMFTAALFTIARICKQPKRPSTEECIKKIWRIYAVEYYATTKRNEMMPFAEMWMDLETVIKSEVSQKEKNKYCILIHIYTESRKMVQMNLFAGKK